MYFRLKNITCLLQKLSWVSEQEFSPLKGGKGKLIIYNKGLISYSEVKQNTNFGPECLT